MKTIKVSGATPVQLDWLVAKCEGVNEEAFNLYYTPTEPSDLDTHGYPEFHYSTIWAQGGPILEREGISIYRMTSDWSAAYNPSGATQDGPTPLIAVMRCYLTSKLGDEAEVPEELI